ncbi:MAG: efflux RND transporter periplasmic adaptor subunit [Polyangiales bacterium]
MSDRLAEDLASLRIERHSTPNTRPARRRTWLRVVVVAVLLGAMGAGVYLATPSVRAQLFKTEVRVTEISMVSPAQASVELTSTGYVVPQTVAKVGPKVVGRVAKVNVKEGARVKALDLLFELDPTDQKSALVSAQSKVAPARARAGAARARALAARSNAAEVQSQRDRQKKLAESGAVAGSAVEDLEMRLRALEAQIAVAEADANSANADSASAQVDVGVATANLANTTIVAPIDGTAVSKPAEVGDVVSPGVTLVELADFKTLLVESDVPEARLHMVKANAPCEIVLDAYPDKRLRGTVAEVSPRLNRSKATGTVKVRFVDVVDPILPEMSARVSFLTKSLDVTELKEPPKKIVPKSALIDRGGAKQVFVIDNGKVRLVTVTLGAPLGEGFELREGPPPGTRLVKDPPATLADGQSIKEGNG